MEPATEVLGTITITMHDDGYSQTSLSPGMVGRSDALRTASSLLARLADSAEAEAQPISCPACGVLVPAVTAAPTGQARFAPCGHEAVAT